MAEPGDGKHSRRLAAAALTASADLDAMWAEVDLARQELSGRVVARRPAGGITIAEYMERYSLCRNTAAHQLARMVDAGIMDQHIVMLPDSRARAVRTIVFVPRKGRKRA